MLFGDAKDNVANIMFSSSPQQGALGCFDFPDKCDKISVGINAVLKPITVDDLKILEPLMYFWTFDVDKIQANTYPIFPCVSSDLTSFYYVGGEGNCNWRFAIIIRGQDIIIQLSEMIMDTNSSVVNFVTTNY